MSTKLRLTLCRMSEDNWKGWKFLRERDPGLFLYLAAPCSMRDLKFPDQGSSPHPAVEAWSLNRWTTRMSQSRVI